MLPGDKVVTTFNQAYIGGNLNPQTFKTSTGGILDGTLRTYGAFNEHALVRAPSTLTAREASTLPCAALTAWNALYGSLDHVVKAGQWVLVQGTGGVSIFVLQFAKAAGARVIATTGSPSKGATLKKLGADHVISYKDDRKWGETAKKLTGGRGVDIIVQVAGVNEMSFQRCLAKMFTARPVFVGSRVQLEEMIEAIEAHPDVLRPVIDERVFKLEELKEAYEYMWAGKHFSKVVIEMN
ncbi:hypothetical protein ACHAO4_005317 [Trichoderma viride]